MVYVIILHMIVNTKWDLDILVFSNSNPYQERKEMDQLSEDFLLGVSEISKASTHYTYTCKNYY